MKIKIETQENTTVITLPKKAKSLSTTIYGGGYKKDLKHVVFHRVPQDFHANPTKKCIEILENLNLDLKSSAVFLTAVDVQEKLVITQKKWSGIFCFVAATVGLSNPASIHTKNKLKNSTINLFVAVDKDVSDNGLVELIKTITEAKVSAIHDIDLRDNANYAVGTTTDALLACSLRDKPQETYSGFCSPLGKLVSNLVYEAVLKGAERTGYRQDRPMWRRLEERGITLDQIVDSAIALFASFKNMGERKIKEIVKEEILKHLRDVNVSSLIEASLRLDEDARIGLVPGLKPKQYMSDPVHLVSDEILAISLALYINGWKSLFELYRYDSKKPGILSKLPPFLDDIIAALIAGATSKIYEERSL